MYYLKRGLILLVIALILGVAFLPWWTTALAERGFKNPKDSASPDLVKKSVQFKKAIFLYGEMGAISERALEVFPRSQHRPFFLYNASIAAEKDGNPRKAIRFAEQFLSEYPQHIWREQAMARLKKMKELHAE